jgi:Tfp pilus assembly protein PilV
MKRSNISREGAGSKPASPFAGRSRLRARLHDDRSDDGISLIEVVVAFLILIVTLVPLTYVLNAALSGSVNARQREAALQLADSWIEILSNSTPPTGPNGNVLTNTPQTPTAPAGAIAPKSTFAGTPFTVTANYSFQSVNQTGQSDLCTDEEPPSPSHPGVIQLQVTVTWDKQTQSLTDTTNINYPKPGLQTEGFLAVQVSNSASDDIHGNSSQTRVAAIPITVSGGGLGSPLTLKPDANGCAFAQVPQGTYTVQVGQPPNGLLAGYIGTPPFVDATGNSSPASFNEQVNVTSETTASVTFDEGISSTVSYGGASAIDSGVLCPGTSSVTCLSLGTGSSGAELAWGDNGANWASASLNAATNLVQAGCTTGASPTCVGVGYKRSGGTNDGVILTTSSGFGTVNADPVPSGVTDVTSIDCPSANGCYAIGSTASGPVLLAGAVGQTSPNQDTWVAVAPPSTTFSSLSSVECLPSTSTCMVGEASSTGGGPTQPGILRVDGDPSAVATNSTWLPTFNLEGPSPNLSSVGTIACPSSTKCLAIATGDSTSSTDPTILAASIATTGPDDWSNESTFPTGTVAVTGLSCTSSTCVAIGSGVNGAPAVWSGDLTDTPDDWAQIASGYPGIPTSVSAVTSVSCGVPSGGDTADCVITATTNAPSTPSELLEGSLNGSWAWNPTGATVNSPVLYYTSVSCVAPGGGGSTCAAAGATANGPIIATTSAPNSSSWNLQTPSSLPGRTVNGIPLETSPASLASWTTQVTQAQAKPTNATSLSSVFYPLATGYSIVAGDCATEANNYSTTSLSASPGGTASPTVPLGLLPLRVVSGGTPVGGATITLTSTQCSPDTYNMPATDASGMSRNSVPYGNYSVAVNGTAVATISMSSNSVTVTVGGIPSTTYLPQPVVVP